MLSRRTRSARTSARSGRSPAPTSGGVTHLSCAPSAAFRSGRAMLLHTLGVREHLDDADDPNDVEPIVVQNPGGSTYRIYIDTVTSFWGPAFIPGPDGLPPRGGLLGVVNRVLAKM